MSVSSFVHHRLENGHGRDTGTTAAIVLLITVFKVMQCSVELVCCGESNRCGNVAKVLGQLEVEVDPISCPEV